MDRVYASIRKNGGKIHLLDANGRTLCQIENCGSTIYERWFEQPAGHRRLCMNCVELETIEPRLSVLMGEEMA